MSKFEEPITMLRHEFKPNTKLIKDSTKVFVTKIQPKQEDIDVGLKAAKEALNMNVNIPHGDLIYTSIVNVYSENEYGFHVNLEGYFSSLSKANDYIESLSKSEQSLREINTVNCYLFTSTQTHKKTYILGHIIEVDSLYNPEVEKEVALSKLTDREKKLLGL